MEEATSLLRSPDCSSQQIPLRHVMGMVGTLRYLQLKHEELMFDLFVIQEVFKINLGGGALSDSTSKLLVGVWNSITHHRSVGLALLLHCEF